MARAARDDVRHENTASRAVSARMGERKGFEERKKRRRDFERSVEASEIGRKTSDLQKGPRRRSKVEGEREGRKRATASSKRPRKRLSKSIDNRDRSKTPPSELFRAKANGRAASRRRKIVARRSNGAERRAVREKRASFDLFRKGPRREMSAPGYLHSSEERAERAKSVVRRSAPEISGISTGAAILAKMAHSVLVV